MVQEISSRPFEEEIGPTEGETGHTGNNAVPNQKTLMIIKRRRHNAQATTQDYEDYEEMLRKYLV